MPNLTPASTFDDVPELETSTLALGGPGGPMNLPLQALLNRTQWLHDNAAAGSSSPHATAAGTANAITATYTPAIAAVVNGLKLRFTAATANTGAATFAPDAIAAAAILGQAGLALQGGELAANSEVELTWSSAAGAWVMTACTDGALQVDDGSASHHAASKGQLDAVNAVAIAAAPSADLASTATGEGAALVGIKRTDVSNAIASALSNWLDAEPINVVRDYGFDNTGATTNDASLATMLASLQLNVDGRGRRIVFKAGTYKFGTSMDFTAYAAGLVHNIYLEGEGCSNTVLDFSAAPAGTDGVTFDAGAHFGVKNLTISGAMRHGLVIGRGTTVGGTSYCNLYIIENVRVQGCGGNGIQSQNSYLGSYRDVWTKNNGGSGFVLAGFHTALSVERVESSDNALAGFSVNGVCYSHFTACGADVNMTQGWALSNMQGVTITSCGAESNGRDGWFFFSSDTSATGLTVQQTNIRGVVLEGCYGLSNSTSSPGTYATFVGATSANGRSININVKGGVAHPAQTTDSAFVLQGVLGKITVHKDAFDDSSFIAADQATGDTSVNDMSIIGRRCLLQAASSQSIPTGADTLINTWNTTPNANDLGATVSASQITIPRGVNKVVVSAGMAWSAASGGSYRLMKIFKNAAGFAGQGQQTTGVASFGLCSARSAVVSVAAGDTFELHVQHDAGVAASTIGTNNSMWFCVEAVG
ncbi:MAG: hypothetical protein ABS82_00060 [Rhodanobacter sp. SCN 67-45]|nr:MAG: hypothetical protein ABS82_00060 [Rhodanobacter sp. SCN 67-45]